MWRLEGGGDQSKNLSLFLNWFSIDTFFLYVQNIFFPTYSKGEVAIKVPKQKFIGVFFYLLRIQLCFYFSQLGSFFQIFYSYSLINSFQESPPPHPKLLLDSKSVHLSILIKINKGEGNEKQGFHESLLVCSASVYSLYVCVYSDIILINRNYRCSFFLNIESTDGLLSFLKWLKLFSPT